MSEPKTTVSFSLGPLADPIGQQLHRQGIRLSATHSKALQQDADAISRLYLRDLLTDAEVKKARKRLGADIMRAIKDEACP